MPAKPSASETSKWRFSLKTLFLWTLLAAVAVWLTSWRMWDTDERLIIGSLLVVLAGAIFLGRHYGWMGALLATVIGGSVPTGMAFIYYIVSELVWEYSDIDRSDIPKCAVFVACTGSALGAIAGATFAIRRVAKPVPSKGRILNRRLQIVVCGLIATALVGIVAWSWYSQLTRWTIRGETRSDYLAAVGPKRASLSSNGSHLIVIAQNHDNPNQCLLSLWKLSPFNKVPIIRKAISSGSVVAVSHNGTWAAIAEPVPREVVISVVELATGAEVARLEVAAPPNTFDDAKIHFSADDKELRFAVRSFGDCSASSTNRWRTGDWKPLAHTDGDGGAFGRSQFYVKLVELDDTPMYDRKFRVELWDLAAKSRLHSFAPFSDPRPIVLSPDGKQLAVHNWLIDLETRAVRQVPYIVEQYLPESQVLLCSRQYHPFKHRTIWNEWRDESGLFPFVRHLPQDMPQESLLRFDLSTGRVTNASQWVPGYRSNVVVSEEGNVAVTINLDRILVWEIPK